MISSSSIVRQQFNKLGILLLICLSLRAAIPARDSSHAVTVAVFGLFRPERVDITTPHNAVVSIQSGSAEVKRVLGSGQRLQVECRGEQLEVKVFEHDQRLLLTYSADAVRTEETVCTLSVPGRIQRDFSGRAGSCRATGPGCCLESRSKRKSPYSKFYARKWRVPRNWKR